MTETKPPPEKKTKQIRVELGSSGQAKQNQVREKEKRRIEALTIIHRK